MTLVVRCPRCGREVDASQVRDGACRRCRVEAAIGSEQADYARLTEKRERYLRRGGSVDALDRQLDRVRRRMIDRARDILPPGDSAADAIAEVLAGDERDMPPAGSQIAAPVDPGRRTGGGIILP